MREREVEHEHHSDRSHTVFSSWGRTFLSAWLPISVVFSLPACAVPVPVAPDGCGPGSHSSVDDGPLQECILGFWLQPFSSPCGPELCSDGGPAECDAGCRVVAYEGFYVDGGFVTGQFTASGTTQTCSSVGAPAWSTYTADERGLSIGGGATQRISCTDSDRSSGWRRAHGARSLLCAAMKSGDGGAWAATECHTCGVGGNGWCL